jgi:hypothetical protein
MNLNSRSNRASRRVRVAKDLLTIIRDNLQEAEAELYIDGATRNVDEANALTTTRAALDDLEERLVSLSMVLTEANKRDSAPDANEFDGLPSMVDIAKTEGLFRRK